VGEAIGEVLPLAIGVAISPIPIIAASLMLLSPRARGTGLGFGLGWLLGIVVAVTVFTLLSTILPEQDASGAKPVAGVIKIIVGAGLLLLAIMQWRRRPRTGGRRGGRSARVSPDLGDVDRRGVGQ
jgi:threonine/homoserine/homoserine lactone efflux protein